MRPDELPGDERPDVGVEVDGAGPLEQAGERLFREHAELGRCSLQDRRDFGTVGHTSARAEVEARLVAGRQVVERAVRLRMKRPPRPSVSRTMRSTAARPSPRMIASSPGAMAE